MANAKRKNHHSAPILAPFRIEYGAGTFPGFPRSIEGGMKSMWKMIVDRKEYNNGAIYDRHVEQARASTKKLDKGAEPKKEVVGRIRLVSPGVWTVECKGLMVGRKVIRRVK